MNLYRRACAAVIRDHRILMLLHRHHDHEHWGLPGGGIEPGESAAEAALRELREEAGLDGHNPVFLYDRPWGREQRGDRELCFLVEVDPAQEPRQGSDPGAVRQDIAAVAWQPVEEVRDHPQVAAVLAALHPAPPALPALVHRAVAAAADAGFEHSCLPEVGRLLQTLAGIAGTIGEIGAGCGVSTAWLASGLRPDARLISVDADPERSQLVTGLFAGDERVRVITGDWQALLTHGPFDLLFVDAGPAKREGPEEVIDALRIGGLAVLDDFTPEELWPPAWRGRPDPVRALWLHHSRLASTIMTVAPSMQVILATRVG